MIVPGTPIVPYGDDPFSDDAEYWIHLQCPVTRREPVLATVTEITIGENSVETGRNRSRDRKMQY